MYSSNLFGNVEDENDIPQLPRLIDFTTFQLDNEHSLQPFLNDFVSPPIFDANQPVIDLTRPQQPPFSFFQTYSFGRPSSFNFHIGTEPDIPPPKKVVCRQKRKNFQTRKIQCITQCPICLVDIKKSCKIPKLMCKHEFHKKCLVTWMQKQETCPLCRLDLSVDAQ